MHSFRRILAIALCLSFITAPCLAEESSVKTILKDTLIGGLTGGLVGAAVMAFTKKPGNNLDFVGYGAAAGMVVGGVYGSVVATRSLAEVDQGEVKFALPTIRPGFRESSRGQTSFVATAELIRGRF